MVERPRASHRVWLAGVTKPANRKRSRPLSSARTRFAVARRTAVHRIILRRHRGIVRKVSANDEMYLDDDVYYYLWGRRALERIQQTLQLVGLQQIERILVLPCGHGRELRFLQNAFPNVHIVACDTNRDAVDFCVDTFGADRLYSHTDPRCIASTEGFDVIWCGSLLSISMRGDGIDSCASSPNACDRMGLPYLPRMADASSAGFDPARPRWDSTRILSIWCSRTTSALVSVTAIILARTDMGSRCPPQTGCATELQRSQSCKPLSSLSVVGARDLGITTPLPAFSLIDDAVLRPVEQQPARA